MMKKTQISNMLLWSVAILTTLLAACSDPAEDDLEEEEPEIEIPACRITSWTEDSGSSEWKATFGYDAQGLLQSMKIVSSYDGETSNDELRLKYDNSVPSTVDYYEDGQLTNADIRLTYSGENLANVKMEFDGEALEARFTYTTGQIKVDYYTDGVLNEDGSVILEFDGNNVTSAMENYETCSSTPDGQEDCRNVTERATYTYDNKLNPLYGNVLFAIWDDEYQIVFSKNNSVKAVYEEEGSGNTWSSTFSYVYNADGFPTSVTSDDGDLSTLEYNCD